MRLQRFTHCFHSLEQVFDSAKSVWIWVESQTDTKLRVWLVVVRCINIRINPFWMFDLWLFGLLENRSGFHFSLLILQLRFQSAYMSSFICRPLWMSSYAAIRNGEWSAWGSSAHQTELMHYAYSWTTEHRNSVRGNWRRLRSVGRNAALTTCGRGALTTRYCTLWPARCQLTTRTKLTSNKNLNTSRTGVEYESVFYTIIFETITKIYYYSLQLKHYSAYFAPNNIYFKNYGLIFTVRLISFSK